MTKKLFILVFIFCPIFVWSQMSLENESLIEPEINHIYRGIPNIIKIKDLENKTGLSLKCSNEKVRITKRFKDVFSVSANISDSESPIKLNLYQGEKLVFSKSYDIKNVGKPIAQLGNIIDSVATIAQILSKPNLKVVIPNCLYDHKFRITNFQISVISSGKTKPILNIIEMDTLYSEDLETGEFIMSVEKIEPYSRTDTQGRSLTKSQIKEIKKLKSDDKILISGLRAICPDCSARKLKDLVITIK